MFYHVKNTVTDEEFEISVKNFDELKLFLKENPHMKQVFRKFPGTGDPMRLGIKKIDDGFKDILKTVKKGNRRSNIDTR